MNEKYGLYALFSMRYTNSPIHDFTTWKRRIVIKIVDFFHEFYQSLYRTFSKENNAFVFFPTICNSSIKISCSAHAKIIICHSVMFLLIHNMKYPIMYCSSDIHMKCIISCYFHIMNQNNHFIIYDLKYGFKRKKICML